jgi:hypothetical protein
MEKQASRRKRSPRACGGEGPVASGGSGAEEATGGDLVEAAAPLGSGGGECG